MDALAIAVAALGLILAANEQVFVGATMSLTALVGLAIGLARGRRFPTVLPFSFVSHFVVMPGCVVASLVAQKQAPAVAFGVFGFWIYYYGCVALAEREVRYVPWASGLAWRRAHAVERPMVYWSFVALFMGMAASFLGAALFSSAR
jgi:hypothetical protein